MSSKLAIALAANGSTGKNDLVALVSEVEATLLAARETIALEEDRILDLANETPDRSRDLISKSQLVIERLSKGLVALNERIQQIDAAEYARSWNEQADELEAQQDRLAQRWIDLYWGFIEQFPKLYAEIDALDKRIAEHNGKAPRGRSRRVIETELRARNLKGYDADNPRLRDNLKLVHPKTGRICFPPEPVNYAALAMVEAVQRLEQKHAGLYSSDWHEFESARQAQLRREAAAREEGLRAKSAADRRKYESKLLAADRKARGIVEETP